MSTTKTPDIQKIVIDGKEYVPAESVSAPPTGTRAVIVVDRGWIFAGDVIRANGRIMLTRAVWVFSWSSIGFDGVLANPKDTNVNLRKLSHNVDLPADSEIFCIPVCDSWGL